MLIVKGLLRDVVTYKNRTTGGSLSRKGPDSGGRGGPDFSSKEEEDNVLHNCNFLVTICVVLSCR